MKNFALFVSLLLVAGAPKVQADAAKSHDTTVEFVSADSVKKTVTIKSEDGKEKTVPVEGKADLTVYQITKVTKGRIKPGDKITVTCRDNEKGEHQAITAIVAAPAAPAKTK